MKKLLYTLATIFVSSLAMGQTTTENYIKNIAYQVKTTDGDHKAGTTTDLIDDDKIESVTYFDGLGRPKQSIAKQAGGNKEDIITYIEYDDYGRQIKGYLPYASGTGSLNIRDGDIELATTNFYNTPKYENTPNPFSEKHFEASPLNRVLEQGAPGTDWAVDKENDSDHTIKFEYGANTVSDYVKHYEVSFQNNNLENPQLVDTGEYNPNELYKTITKDENWTSSDGKDKTTEEYKNKQGQVVLKRVFNNTQWHDTYYVYDDFGNLTYVLPPKLNTYKFIDHQDWGNESFDISSLFVGTEHQYTNCYFSFNTSGTLSINFEAIDDSGNGVVFNNAVFPLPSSLSNLPDMTLGDLYFMYGSSNLAGTFSIQSGNLHITSSGLPSAAYDWIYIGFTVDLSDYQSAFTPQAITQTQLNDLAYQYKYDKRNRLIEKKIPGKGWEYIVYDNLNRPALTQNTNMHNNGNLEWLLTKYDAFGRVAYTAIAGGVSNDRYQIQSFLDVQGASVNYVTRVSSGTGHMGTYYSNSGFPGTGEEILTISHYDEYIGLPIGFTAPTTVLGQTVRTNTKGLPTVNKVKVLGENHWITTITYYDDKARPIYVYSENPFLGTTDIVESKLNFLGNVIKNKTTHKKTGQTDIVTIDTFEYDHAARLASQTQKIGSQADELIALNNYDELGQLENKKVGGAVATNKENSIGLQTVDYTYNIRGWLKTINNPNSLGSDLFSFGINYNTPSHPYSTINKPLYNGNIAHTYWKTNNESSELREYAYRYDDLNRFQTAYYAEDGSNNNKYNVYIHNYDKNGNIGSLMRYMPSDLTNPLTTGYAGMDHLTYAYDGNKLLNVRDSNGLTTTGVEGFKDGNVKDNTGLDDYAYDDNGNMLKDLNKGITSNISYNHLNLPTNIPFSSGNISYIYDATGLKLEKKIVESGNPDKYTYYAGNYVYENSSLKFFNHLEGYIEPIDPNNLALGFEYVYQYKDHLGNVRLSYKDSDNNGIVTGENNYITEFSDDIEDSDGWDSVGALYGTSATEDTQHVHSGSKSIKLSKPSSGSTYAHSNNWISISDSETTEYIYSGWFYSDGPGAQFHFFMNEGTEASYFTLVDYVRNYTKNKWVYMEKKVSVPANIDKINFRVDLLNGNGNIWFDDLKIVRLDPTGNSEILEENNYYPFGLKHKGYNENVSANVNSVATKFEFQGVEFEEALGLNLHEMDFRNYDPALGRFTGIDPVTHHSMSPYVAFDNNPIFWVDPSGANAEKDKTVTNTTTNTYSYVDANNNTHVVQSTMTTVSTTADDGSISITATNTSIENIVDVDGNIVESSKGITSEQNINIDAEGNASFGKVKSTETDRDFAKDGKSLSKWTKKVSNHNKNNESIYNKSQKRKGALVTTAAFGVGSLPITLAGGGMVTLPVAVSEALGALSLPSSVSVSSGLVVGGTVLNMTSSNSYLIMHDSSIINNGNVIRPSNESNLNRRNNSVGPTSFQDLFKIVNDAYWRLHKSTR